MDTINTRSNANEIETAFQLAVTGKVHDNPSDSEKWKQRAIQILKHPIKFSALAISLTQAKIANIVIIKNIKLFWGDSMTIAIPEQVSQLLWVFGYFEPGLSKIVIDHVHPGDIFFDAGAHYGYFSLLSASLGAKCHAFEPTPLTYAILHRNALGRNININNFALYDHSGYVRFDDCGVEYASYNHVSSKHDNNGYNVRCMKLDEYVEQTGAIPNFIKIDAEGAEYAILNGGRKTIENHKPKITLETGHDGTYKAIDYLLEIGYTPYECRNGKMVIYNHTEKDNRYNNILFVPSSNPS